MTLIRNSIGAFGEVKKAVHKATGVTRAVKIIYRVAQEVNQYDQILNEIKILKTLVNTEVLRSSFII